MGWFIVATILVLALCWFEEAQDDKRAAIREGGTIPRGQRWLIVLAGLVMAEAALRLVS